MISIMAVPSPDLDSLFVRYLLGRRQVAESTARDYMRGLARFEKETGAGRATISALSLEEFLALPLGWAAKNQTLVAARLYHAWGARRGYWALDPEVSEIRLKRQNGRETRPLTFEDALAILGAVRTPEEKRVVMPGFYAGLRAFEILDIRRTWWVVGVDRTEELRILGKGSIYRRIPVHPKLSAVREDVLAGVMTKRQMRSVVESLRERSGVSFTVRALRRTFSERLSRAGVERAVIGHLLGHSTSSVTERHYAPVRWEEALAAIRVLDYGTGQMRFF
jgi:integrase